MPYTRSVIEPKYDYYLGDWTESLETILRAGASAFEKIAPYVIKQKNPTPPYTGYPSPYPQLPSTYRYGPIPPGGIPGGPSLPTPMPAWFWPAAAGIGGFALISMMQKRR